MLESFKAYWSFNKEGILIGAAAIIVGAFAWGIMDELGRRLINRIFRAKNDPQAGDR